MAEGPSASPGATLSDDRDRRQKKIVRVGRLFSAERAFGLARAEEPSHNQGVE
jgi:hypothetical protein